MQRLPQPLDAPLLLAAIRLLILFSILLLIPLVLNNKFGVEHHFDVKELLSKLNCFEHALSCA